MTHQLNEQPSTVQTHPVTVAESIRMLAAIAVAAGWLTSQQANTITIGLTALGVLVSVGASYWSGRKVTALAKPQDTDGTPLVPVGTPGISDG